MPAHFENLPDMDAIFNLESFKFMDIKKVLNIIIANLGDLNNKFNHLETKFDKLEVPDISKLMLKMSEMEKRQFEVEKKNSQLSNDFESFKIMTNTSIEEINFNFPTRDNELEEMIKNMMLLIEGIKPVAPGINIDTSLFVTIEDYESLTKRIDLIEKRNIEQDERLTNNEHRISKLE
jgi:hypothetical protein